MDDVLAQFAAEIGMAMQPREPEMPAVFRFESSGRLFIEERGERVLVYLEGPTMVSDGHAMLSALASCTVERRHEMPVRVGLTSDDHLVFGIVLQDAEFTLQALHAALEQLKQHHADLVN